MQARSCRTCEEINREITAQERRREELLKTIQPELVLIEKTIHALQRERERTVEALTEKLPEELHYLIETEGLISIKGIHHRYYDSRTIASGTTLIYQAKRTLTVEYLDDGGQVVKESVELFKWTSDCWRSSDCQLLKNTELGTPYQEMYRRARELNHGNRVKALAAFLIDVDKEYAEFWEIIDDDD